MNLKATGRTKKLRYNDQHTHGIRQADRRIEYRCLDCKHTGWSRHIDAARLLSNRRTKTLQGPR